MRYDNRWTRFTPVDFVCLSIPAVPYNSFFIDARISLTKGNIDKYTVTPAQI